MNYGRESRRGSAWWGFSGDFNGGFPRTQPAGEPAANTPAKDPAANDSNVRPPEAQRPWEQLKLF